MIRITVRVKPGASREFVGGSYGDPPALIVSVNAQAVDGKANDSVTSVLATALGIKSRDCHIVAGHTGRTKIVAVSVSDENSERISQQIQDLLHLR